MPKKRGKKPKHVLQKIKNIYVEPHSTKPKVKELLIKLQAYKRKIVELNSLNQELVSINEKIDSTQEYYKKFRSIDSLKLDFKYQALLLKRKEIQHKISMSPNVRYLNNKIKDIEFVIKTNYNQIKTSTLTEIKINQQSITTIFIEWEDLKFYDCYISIKFKGSYLEKFPVADSKQSFNVIKDYYKFKNAPKLCLEISGRWIKRIVNFEVLFYYLHFFKNAGTSFDKVLFTTSKSIFLQSKSFYQKHFPDLFQPRCFSYLCKHCSDELPIVPVSEFVLHQNGTYQIHDSFLFPIKKESIIYWIWESIEELKATYIFYTPFTDYKNELQKLYDYLTGEIINKRRSLIDSSNLKKHLNCIDRKIHTSFDEWSNNMLVYV